MDVLLDANVVIDLIPLDCFESVLRFTQFCLWVAENVRQGIVYSNRQERLEQQLREGHIRETQVEDTEELKVYAELKKVLGDGEAASLAVVRHRGWPFVTYERGRTEREARQLVDAS